jgi:23S rRNA maturation-related 3'-5' exoribonuclease YhaM
MIKKINLDAILASNTKGEKHEGVGYILSFTKKVSEGTGKQFITFNLCDNGTICSGKVWQENIEAFEKATQNSKIINLSGTVDTFGGTSSIVVTSCSEYIGPFTIVDFVKGYDEDELKKEFWGLVETNTSTKAQNCLKAIFEEPIVKERFFKEFAGKAMHDAKPGGLANHTIKMMELFITGMKRHDFWKKNVDLIMMGIAVHDIGKVREMTNGSYNKNSFITHIQHGCEILTHYKDIIVENFGEDFYAFLESIIVGHHDEFETKARTIYALIVHMLDNLEAKLTGFAEAIEGNNYSTSENGDAVLNRDRLNFNPNDWI